MLKHKLINDEMHVEFEDIFELKISSDSLLQNKDITIKNIKELCDFLTKYSKHFICELINSYISASLNIGSHKVKMFLPIKNIDINDLGVMYYLSKQSFYNASKRIDELQKQINDLQNDNDKSAGKYAILINKHKELADKYIKRIDENENLSKLIDELLNKKNNDSPKKTTKFKIDETIHDKYLPFYYQHFKPDANERIIFVFGCKDAIYAWFDKNPYSPNGGALCGACDTREKVKSGTRQYIITNKGKIISRWVRCNESLTAGSIINIVDLKIDIPCQVIELLSGIGEDVFLMQSNTSCYSGYLDVTKAVNIIKQLCDFFIN